MSPRSHLTIALCTVLHAFTHAFGTILVPLYLLIVADLNLGGVKAASFIVTIYGLTYCVMSFAAGILADRFDRKKLLGYGLIGNAIAVAAMGLTHQYPIVVALAVMAGACGSLFHPAANALATEHYPKSPGMAIGMLGIGAGIGFFVGPQYAGWRAQTATWQFAAASNWQRPCVEMGAAGIVFGLIFLLLAREVRGRHPAMSAISISGATSPGGPQLAPNPTGDSDSPKLHPPLGAKLRRRVLAIALTLGMRDYAGVAALSLTSIYLQKARGLGVQQTGLILGSMVLVCVIVNPLSVWLTHGKRRLPILTLALAGAGAVLATVPLWSTTWVLPVLCVFQAMHLGGYAMSDAAILERLDPNVRGRVVGLYLTIAGTIASSSPWLMGFWTDALKDHATTPSAYIPIYGTIAAMMAFAAVSTPLIARLGKATAARAIDPISETGPAMMEVVG